jgi:hypothetical protein
MTFVAGSHAQKFGTEGEQTVEEWLKGRGFYVVRLCTIRNYDGTGAPMLMGSACNLILPDLQVLDPMMQKPPAYVEVKHKTQAPLNYKLGHVPVHGIGQWNWKQYQRVEQMTGVPVWLLILEHLTGELLALRTSVPPDDCFGGSAKGVDEGGMVYWRKSRFVLLAELAQVQQRLDLEDAAA